MASKVMTNSAVANSVMAEAVSDAEIVAQFRQRGCWGLYTSVDLKGCDPASIRDAEKIHRFIIELCDLIDMKRFGEPQIIHFGPNERVAGFSMTQLIETSLVSGHFANETNAAYLDIFSCKEYEPSKAAEFCKTFFGAETATYQVLFRD
ncbi:MAG: Arginine decarboxylase proenzyme precursor [Euryarchaeota archaeon ADurb.Bin009]|jgi:S-adenosylmethionine/arginine decarboxylase-like enzyme|uniref:S-adenosylmethionine decarboxylase n=1 Tax=Methanoculleus sp. TaxID=90427 RepID=UPI0009D3CFDE|nr:S-adenosylmethionine decarboxylase [Methanoculleus sp.]OQC71872.1 MAG: Arginine decarboxylase proenzyme precursor [Euryarchaeota archaeon ADurb.Bin009]MBP7145546.1 S-adenosylmethionine decarboxylase [Methanoculleus sp.]HNQ33085.1 S-adenosylmethionine decarboxylase [Methanoculleus sp.]HNT06861.1 S-adenosylmethionine decarboxylase [Methanoculleus sp.]HNV39556.1 S-adenosylmethionine decarboxylase [Methanoculleus sp.]